MSLKTRLLLKVIETGLIPERLIRGWVHILCRNACERASLGDIEARHSVYRQILKDLRAGVNTMHKNRLDEQLSEMGADFYRLFLGERLFESCCYFPTGAEDISEAEDTMLWMTADRTKIRDGMHVLDLGCGWGAMTFWLAKQYPEIHITAVTDSVTRGIYIRKHAHELKLNNINVITSEFEDLEFVNGFDRIICLERIDFLSENPGWQNKINSWLNSEGKFFLQSQVHQSCAFYCASVGLEDLPGNVILRKRLVLSADIPLLFHQNFTVEDFWKISGEHYRLTSEKRLAKFYENRLSVLPHLEKAYGKKNAWIWFQRWRCSFIAMSGLAGYNRGQDWITGQYLYKKNDRQS